MVEKKNPDYSESAVMLTNPPQVKGCLIAQRARYEKLAKLEEQAESFIPESLNQEIASLQDETAFADKEIRGFIDTFGSFQDIEKGMYAVKQRKEFFNYKPDLTKKVLEPKLANLVIIEAVDSKALDGLIKGDLVTPIQARQCGEFKETFTYIIK